ncbi:MAG: ABC transporter substrate-binding protein [Chloroflexota bacterium]
MVRYLWRAIGIAVVISVCFCSVYVRAQAGDPVHQPRAAAAPRDILRLAMPDSSPTVDPAVVASDESVQLANLLYLGLVRLDSRYRPVPAAASRIIVSPDHRAYTFVLRRGMRFSNGDPITAEDFAFAINRSLNPDLKSPSAATYLSDIKGAPAVLAGKARAAAGLQVVDAYTLRITVRWPIPYFLMELTYPTSFALDKKAILKVGPIDSSAWYNDPVCSGPYRVKTWTPGSKITLVRNAYYRSPRALVPRVNVSLAALPVTRLYQYVAHNLDIVSLPSGDTTLSGQPAIAQTDLLGGNGVYMRFASSPFDNRQVRQALTQALDRQSLVRASMKGMVTPRADITPDLTGGANSQTHALPFDPVRAARLWRGTRYAKKKSLTLTLYHVDEPAVARLARGIARQWHYYLKVNVTTQSLTFSTLLTRVESNSLPLYLGGWSADYPDPHDWISQQWKSDALNNNIRYRNPRFDAIVETADVTWDFRQREKLYRRAQQILADDAAWIPLYVPHRAVYIRPTVSNVKLTGYGLIPTGGDWANVGIRSLVSRKHSPR